MVSDKKMVEQITARDVDFAQWYTDIVKKAELADYSSVKGCMILRPAAYALWENIQKNLDDIFKRLGHENVAMPMFIPESLLQKEKDHVEGFAPEVAWVTKGGSETLQEPLCVRPTSETLFCEHYANIIQSYRDLPKLYNQWCSVVRWEKTTRPFLRTTEFFWQEGHTAHATAAEAIEETEKMLNVYADFCRDFLAIPVIKGRKTDKEKFAGAKATYTIEALMYDGKALQSGTSHYFGDDFAKAFDIKYSDKENKQQYVHQTSWGISTRIIGAIIMVHSDDNGLVLPPRIAPVQVMIVPIAQHKEGVLEAASLLKERLLKAGIRVKMDSSDKMPGWKFAESEMKGIPLRLEIGPRDIENKSCLAVRRNDGFKEALSLENIEESVLNFLEKIQTDMYSKAQRHLQEHITKVDSWEAFVDAIENKKGFVLAPWNGSREVEDKIKELTGATARCMPFGEDEVGPDDKCIYSGEKAEKMVLWGKAY